MILITLMHKERCLAQLQQAQAKQLAEKRLAQPDKKPLKEHPLEYSVVLAQLKKHQEQLSSLTNVTQKVALKVQLVPEYLDFLNHYETSGANYPNEVMAELIIWLLDTGDIERGLQFAKLAIEQKQSSPKDFKRDLPTACAEMIFEWAERQYQEQASASPYFDEVIELVDTRAWLIDQIIVLTKLYKLRALFAEQGNDWQTAVAFYEKCVAINPDKHGVKGRLKLAVKQMENNDSPTQ